MAKRIISIITLLCFMACFNAIVLAIPVPTVQLSASSEIVPYGTDITFTAAVTPETDAGSITFYDGAEALGTCNIQDSEASFTTKDLEVGDHLIKAVYSDGAETETITESNTVTVKVEKLDAQIELVSGKPSISVNDDVRFTATVKNGDNAPIDSGTVKFYKDSSSIGQSEIKDGIAELVYRSSSAGSFDITAEYQGSDIYKSKKSNAVEQIFLSDNNNISSLKVNGQKLKLKSSYYDYSVTVASSDEYAEITVIPEDEDAVITIDGEEVDSGVKYEKIYLKKGRKTEIEIVITAPNNEERSITLYVTRKKSSSGSGGVPIKYRYEKSNPITYGDIAGSWAMEAISGLTNKGIFNGEKEGSYTFFYPDRNMTRTEFAVIIARTMQADLDLTRYLDLPFNDWTAIPQWGLSEVRAVYFNEWMGGDGADFNPEGLITRAEAMTVIARAKGYDGSDAYFSDSADIPSWAVGAICGLVEAGIVNGYYDNTIRPNETITRAEAANIIYNILK